MTGGEGNDYLFGQAGHDIFAFSDTDSGIDVIRDFAQGEDTVQLTSVTGFDDFADILAAAVNSGNHALITLSSGNSIRIDGIQVEDLTAADFDFF